MTVPDMSFARVSGAAHGTLSLGQPSFIDAGGSLGGNGSIDPGEQISITLPLTNYFTNVFSPPAATGVTATLSTLTPGVLVTQGSSSYSPLSAGTTGNNFMPFQVSIANTFDTHNRIDFSLNVTSSMGPSL